MSVIKKVKASMINYGKKHHGFLLLLRSGLNTADALKFKFYSLGAKTNPKLILFESFKGRTYSDSPRALFKEIIKDPYFNDFKFVWVLKDWQKKLPHFPELQELVSKHKLTLIEYEQPDYYRTMARAGYIVTNSRIPNCIKFRKDQKYIQCWHGTPLKCLGLDIKENGNAMNTSEDLHKQYEVETSRFNYFISPSRFGTEKFISCFGIDKFAPHCKILETGYPRNDILANYTKEDVSRIKKSLGLDNPTFKGKKVILYAPTWRDDQHIAGKGYVYESPIDFDKLKSKLGDKYVILFRTHYFITNSFDFKKYQDFIIDVSTYEDISDLYLVSDILVTDYSSSFFDYSILNRPIVLYMYDYGHYENNLHNFYFDPHQLPWPIVKTEDELVKAIKAARPAMNNFAKQFISLEDGKASKRVINEIWKQKTQYN